MKIKINYRPHVVVQFTLFTIHESMHHAGIYIAPVFFRKFTNIICDLLLDSTDAIDAITRVNL